MTAKLYASPLDSLGENFFNLELSSLCILLMFVVCGDSSDNVGEVLDALVDIWFDGSLLLLEEDLVGEPCTELCCFLGVENAEPGNGWVEVFLVDCLLELLLELGFWAWSDGGSGGSYGWSDTWVGGVLLESDSIGIVDCGEPVGWWGIVHFNISAVVDLWSSGGSWCGGGLGRRSRLSGWVQELWRLLDDNPMTPSILKPVGLIEEIILVAKEVFSEERVTARAKSTLNVPMLKVQETYPHRVNGTLITLGTDHIYELLAKLHQIAITGLLTLCQLSLHLCKLPMLLLCQDLIIVEQVTSDR